MDFVGAYLCRILNQYKSVTWQQDEYQTDTPIHAFTGEVYMVSVVLLNCVSS